MPESLKKELEPDFVRYYESLVAPRTILYDKNREATLESMRITSEKGIRGEGSQAIGMAIQQELLAKKLLEDSEYKKAHDEVLSGTKAFATLFTSRMFEILNDEQRKRLQELIDNPPEYVRIHIQRLGSEHWGVDVEGVGKKADVDTDVWVPGAGSWKPGDPLPEGYRPEQRDRRFPRSE